VKRTLVFALFASVVTAAPAAIAQDQTPSMAMVLAIEDARAPRPGDVQLLVSAARAGSLDVKNAAIRALGRLERRSVIDHLIPFLASRPTRAEAANALAQAFREPTVEGPPPRQLQVVLEALLAAGASELSSAPPGALGPVARSIGRLPYANPDQVRSAEAFLRDVLGRRDPKTGCHLAEGGRAVESLARINRKLATLEDETADALRTIVSGLEPKCASARRNALAALIAAQKVDGETLKTALGDTDPETRRLGVVALTGSGSVMSDEQRLGWIQSLLTDASFMVRYEAVRAWTRRGSPTKGCTPLVEALSDSSLHVVLAALDALGDQCHDATEITERLASEARTPPNIGHWQREAHAFVALAKRDRERAAIGMMTFATHQVWQVRMYAARAAAIAGDVGVLERLASDPDNNVAEAALAPLRVKVGADSDALFIAALKRTSKSIGRNVTSRPYQLTRTAAKSLERAQPTRALVEALAGALERISEERCETSRDARLALIERLGELGSAAQERVLIPLLKDQDPVVATAAASLLKAWTGRTVEVESPKRMPISPSVDERHPEGLRILVEMEGGERFDVAMRTDTALTRARVISLVARGYYDDLTFHRVVPNFVIQGGSPDANEYCGDCAFMRDELGLAMHERGTIGISTRGRDTGDAQIFINLVDNARLDHEYTVFARVCSDRGMDVVDQIQEGDKISRIRMMPATPTCGRQRSNDALSFPDDVN
jgi:cyclophilin family peptidyl-prolyl cis-trans isomerase/HEAT repeat protein